jgi:hypothetical protein
MKFRSVSRSTRRFAKTIEQAVDEELRATLGAAPYERHAERSGYRNGTKTRTLTGPTGPVELTLPRGRLATSDGGAEEWRSTVVPRYQRRMREVNEAVAGVYLSGGNTRRIRGALRPLLKNAPLSKSAVSRIRSGARTRTRSATISRGSAPRPDALGRSGFGRSVQSPKSTVMAATANGGGGLNAERTSWKDVGVDPLVALTVVVAKESLDGADVGARFRATPSNRNSCPPSAMTIPRKT